jgi:hypothetical protein
VSLISINGNEISINGNDYLLSFTFRRGMDVSFFIQPLFFGLVRPKRTGGTLMPGSIGVSVPFPFTSSRTRVEMRFVCDSSLDSGIVTPAFDSGLGLSSETKQQRGLGVPG